MFLLVVLLLLASSHVWANNNQMSDKEMHPNIFPTFRSINNVKINEDELTSQYWRNNAQKTISEKIGRKLNQNTAKNVILFLGDGMSIPTVAAARVYLGGEETQLSFDQFPYTGLSKTYAIDRQVADSANTATAYLCGVKANYGTIGVGPEIQRSDCAGQRNETIHAYSIAYYSQLKNKASGLVTTARVTHASPAGVYAHTADRNWESDANVLDANQDPSVCADIATQLVYGETGRNLNVVMGGGRAKLLPKDVKDDEGTFGERRDGIDLTYQWTVRRENSAYVWNRDQLLNLNDSVTNLLGLFATDHIDYNLDRDPTLQPSLAEMTEAAIKVLNKNKNGYFLFVEGARIDMGHHAAEAKIALDETAELSKAVQVAVDLTNEEDTLIVVTSDHAHTMSYSGYGSRGSDILGFGGVGSDQIPYTTLNYANGPGYKPENDDGSRYDISGDNYDDNHYKYPSVAPLSSETRR